MPHATSSRQIAACCCSSTWLRVWRGYCSVLQEGWEGGAWQTPSTGQPPDSIKLLRWRFLNVFVMHDIQAFLCSIWYIQLDKKVVLIVVVVVVQLWDHCNANHSDSAYRNLCIKKLKNISCEYDWLNGWNSTSICKLHGTLDMRLWNLVVNIQLFFFFSSSGGWGKIKL